MNLLFFLFFCFFFFFRHSKGFPRLHYVISLLPAAIVCSRFPGIFPVHDVIYDNCAAPPYTYKKRWIVLWKATFFFFYYYSHIKFKPIVVYYEEIKCLPSIIICVLNSEGNDKRIDFTMMRFFHFFFFLCTCTYLISGRRSARISYVIDGPW